MIIREKLTMIISEKHRAASLGSSPLNFYLSWKGIDKYDRGNELWEIVNKILINDDN